MSPTTPVDDLLRELAPRVLGGLVRRYGDFATCEDAVQEALLAAALQWPAEGVPAGIRLMTTDADGDHADLEARGVDADPEVMRIPEAPAMFSLRDPDGNNLILVEWAE